MKRFEDYVRKFGAGGLGYFQMKESGLKGPLTKFFTDEDIQAIRKKYLKLSKEHHPDLLISKGVPTEIIEESKKKMRAINSAWDQIQKLKLNEKGLKIPVSEVYNPKGISLTNAIVLLGGGTSELISEKLEGSEGQNV